MNRNVPASTARALAGAFMLVALLSPSSSAEAQAAPDLRNIRPMVTLLVDSSGSMERLANCVCTTFSCNECLPDCSVPEYSRWHTLLEAFTGTFDTFTCTEDDRSSYVGDYDHNYFIPHYDVGASTQQNNGVLDVYLDRIRFALMTFDAEATLTNQPTLVPTPAWSGAFISSSNGAQGMYSYGGPKEFAWAGCATTYSLDNGARNEQSNAGAYIPGNLVSMGDDSSDHAVINAAIQSGLLDIRPYGPTPTAAMLDDYRYYINNHTDVIPVANPGDPGDPYAECRNKYAVLVTDGHPNADMRGLPYQCETGTCPYDLPETIAADLCAVDGDGECAGDVDGVFVVGFNVADAAAKTSLDLVAAAGGTTEAYFATDRASLVAALSAAFDAAAPGATSRTVPAFVSSASVAGAGGQYQFNTGFSVGGVTGDAPWGGVIDRRRFRCCVDALCTGDAPGTVVVAEDIESTENDRFHEVLNARATPRNLWTVLPTTPGDEDGWLTNDPDSIVPAARVLTGVGTPTEQSLDLVALETSTGGGTVTFAHMNAADLTEADSVLDWVYARGSAPASRLANRLSDIYHSSPAVIAAPRIDRTDDSYNSFRRQGNVLGRPTVLYVGTNDGVLHAFAVEDHDVAGVCADSREDATACDHAAYDSSNLIGAGEELWGFVPPILVPKLKDAATSHQWMSDGTPIVKDVYYARVRGSVPPANGDYETVLVAGLRGGAAGAYALEVTDPVTAAGSEGDHVFQPPRFLWQFTDSDMGETYGNPAIAQVLIDEGASTIVARAVAIIPGGQGTATGAANAGLTAAQLPSGITGITPRAQRPAYGTTGRALYVVDIATGRLIKKFDSTTLTAPMVGSVAAYPGDVGQIADRAFMTDADGVIWRLDLSSADPADWKLTPFHDIFRGQAWDEGQPAYNAPVLSINEANELVILQATGNIDLLDDTGTNRVVSLTESLVYNADGTVDFTSPVGGTLNWELTLDPSEQVTGPLELFDGKVYFGSFKSVVSTTDACQFGESRLWGVHYIDDDGTGSPPGPANGLESTVGGGVDTTYVGPFANQIIMGVAVTQRPTCFTGETVVDTFLGVDHYRVTDQGGGGFQLVAQVGGEGTLTAGASIAEITRSLPAPVSYTTVLGYAGAVD